MAIKIIITAAGLVLIFLINWYFLGKEIKKNRRNKISSQG
jgi:plastocyanin domain-containing protein